jgi:hypothetical protein
VLGIPDSNASLERMFSLMNAFWTNERNQLSIETVQEILITKTHFKDISCVDFYNFIKKWPNLLEGIQS